MTAGIDAFWPDEGDWFNLSERIKRHQLYYQGHLSTHPNVRPWSLQRNGYPGIAQWGGWVWSGDTETSWKTLEAQIAVGINYSLSIGPYWGSDIGGFYPNNELTGELYARWHQFAAFCGSFRSHGRTWFTRLPWGWGLNDMGPREFSNTNAPIPPDDRRNILQSEMNNPAIEPVAKKYSELRYQLMPYTYTLAWEARDVGTAADAGDVAALPGRRARARARESVHVGARPARGAGVHEGRDVSRGVPAEGRVVRLVDECEGLRRTDRHASGRSRDHADLRSRRRHHSGRSHPSVHGRTGQGADDDPRIYPGADGQYTLYEDDGISQEYLKGRGTWTRMVWNDRTKQLTIEPGAPQGATNVVSERIFKVQLMPEGVAKEVTYTGRRVQVGF